MRFSHAIVRKPCKNFTEGLSSAGLGKPDYSLALRQHHEYVRALEICRLEVTVLPPDEEYPDSTFVEDTALLTRYIAITTRPGAESRLGEINEVHRAVGSYYENIFTIHEPGTLEAGDVMMAGEHFYIGISERTNREGARQLLQILEHHGITASLVEVPGMLHLKTGISYLENNTFLAVDTFRMHPEFRHRNIIPVPNHEAYAANSLWVNGMVLVPQGFPITLKNIRNTGYETIELDISEFRKLDGGLSCLSLRF
ncbi:MAG: arginine deiminase family protein [Bacteroidales bacterium]|nr:arginine deiminase family protein [Bacteroidales bacterium]